jgi:hypothetical protein
MMKKRETLLITENQVGHILPRFDNVGNREVSFSMAGVQLLQDFSTKLPVKEQ